MARGSTPEAVGWQTTKRNWSTRGNTCDDSGSNPLTLKWVDTLKGDVCRSKLVCVVARRKQLQICGNVLKKRSEVKQTGYIAFSTEDAKELKVLNRTTKIDVQYDEMASEADTKLVETKNEDHGAGWCKKASIRHVSREMKNEKRRWRALRNSLQQHPVRTAAS